MLGAVTATWMDLVTLDLPDLAASAAYKREKMSLNAYGGTDVVGRLGGISRVRRGTVNERRGERGGERRGEKQKPDTHQLSTSCGISWGAYFRRWDVLWRERRHKAEAAAAASAAAAAEDDMVKTMAVIC